MYHDISSRTVSEKLVLSSFFMARRAALVSHVPVLSRLTRRPAALRAMEVEKAQQKD
jgi:Flp pilus assembly protein protease CpaA